jgi:Protein of unknown function (DUF3467)
LFCEVRENFSISHGTYLSFLFLGLHFFITSIYTNLHKKITMDEQQNPNQINIELTEDIAEGNYINLAIITHSHAEFVLDFANVMPGTPKTRVKNRIIMTPFHAKRLMKALIDNVQKFEAVNGVIKDMEQVELPLNFGGPAAQA